MTEERNFQRSVGDNEEGFMPSRSQTTFSGIVLKQNDNSQ